MHEWIQIDMTYERCTYSVRGPVLNSRLPFATYQLVLPPYIGISRFEIQYGNLTPALEKKSSHRARVHPVMVWSVWGYDVDSLYSPPCPAFSLLFLGYMLFNI